MAQRHTNRERPHLLRLSQQTTRGKDFQIKKKPRVLLTENRTNPLYMW